jgi:ACS family pantothenate transporter-like MFS transporter
MKEDVSLLTVVQCVGLMTQMGFQGNQLNYLDTLFRIGYAVFLIVGRAAATVRKHRSRVQPSQLILTSIRPKFWLPPLELAWGVLTGM